MKIALIQMTSSDDPAANLVIMRNYIREAAGEGAEFILTPEVCNCVSDSRAHQQTVLSYEDDDPSLAGLRAAAAEHGIHLLIGSLGLKTRDGDGRFANRSFLIGPDGGIIAKYDKIHMFDVQVSAEETYRESDGYRPGTRAVLADTPIGRIGLTICYDVRFPHLLRALAQGGAQILTAPAAFSYVTGAAHWEVLQRARAIETGCFVIAPAQTGTHDTSVGKQRKTHGHSMVVAPWGEILADAGRETGVTIVDIDLGEVAKARGRVASLTHDRGFECDF
ncbi:MAG: carbon-nitrogen hydrolase family protein [Rhodobacterales bacterium]|nr:carbon-nitrogen hydrolase family protein [Rhodobacterales bacterium]